MNFRTLVVAVFALIGAAVSVSAVPTVLDFLFERVKASNLGGKTQPDTVQVEQFNFRKAVFASPGSAGRARDAYTAVKSGHKTIDEVCKEGGNVVCEDYAATSTGLQYSGPKSLARLSKQGASALLADDPNPGSSTIYVLKSIDRKTQASIVDDSAKGYPGSGQPLILVALALLGAMVGGGLGSLVFNAAETFAIRWTRLETGDRVNLFLGVVAGIICSLPFLIALSNLGPTVAALLMVGLTLGFSALSVYALNSMEEVLPWKKGEVRGRRSGIKILDTNVLIDGRIYDLVRTGFLEGELYIPKFVLHELQHIADSADALRRQRGRRGLEVLRHLQNDHPVEIGVHDRLATDEKEEVDARLVRLAKALGADLVSNDYNLNRVASIQEVRVLNINDLALALRPNVLPGETMELTIIREGNQYGQGVGYLEDGTMVVVENGKEHIGETVVVSVTQVIQTERGKMIFGTVDEEEVQRSGTMRTK